MLIVDEPTRGIDIGTKAEVHQLLAELASEGVAILMISSELPEVLGMADRILVMREGRLAAEFAARRGDGGKDHVRGHRPARNGAAMSAAVTAQRPRGPAPGDRAGG